MVFWFLNAEVLSDTNFSFPAFRDSITSGLDVELSSFFHTTGHFDPALLK